MASSSSAATWYPPTQRVQVKVGKVLNKAIKARKLKGEPAPPPTTTSRIPDFHYHSFLFKHKPLSIDNTRPATLQVKKSPEGSVFAHAEFPSVNAGDAYSMMGEETPAKEVDCLLIYDEVANTWTLEKVDSFVRFQAHTKVVPTSPRPASPASIVGTPSLKKTKVSRDKDDDLERQLLDLAGSSVQEERSRKPPPPPAPAPSGPGKRPADSDDEEGEIEVPLRLLHQPPKEARNIKPIPKTSPKTKPPPPPSPRPPLPKPAAPIPISQPAATPTNAPKPSKPIAKPSAALSSASLPPKPTPPAPPEPMALPLKSKRARPIPAIAVPPPPNEVVPPTPQPLKPSKRQRVAAPPPKPTPPPQPKPLDLSLPGGSGTFAPPPLPPSLAKPATAKVAPPPPPPIPKDPAAMIVDSDEEDEWDPVEVAPEPTHELPQVPHSFNIVMEEENDYVIPDARGGSMEDDVDPDLAAALDEELFSLGATGDGGDIDYGSDADGDGEEPEDFLALAMSNEPGLPMSLNQYAEQNIGGDDSDVTSSSSEEDSDEE